MQVLLGKFNKRKLCLSTMAMGLIVLICAVIIQAPIKGRAAGETRATVTVIEYGVYGFNYFKVNNNLMLVPESQIGEYVKGMSCSGGTITISDCRDIQLKINTFTNKNVKISLIKSSNVSLIINNKTTISLDGDNNDIKSINATKDITIEGTGKMNIGDESIPEAINSTGTINFNHTGAITVSGKQGILCNSYSQTLGTVNVTSTAGVGIQANNGDINISGGTITVNSTEGHGINCTNGSVTITSSTVEASTGSLGTASGIVSKNGVTINDGSNVRISASSLDGSTCGIQTSTDTGVGTGVTITGGTLDISLANSISSSKKSSAIATNKLNISGGIITLDTDGESSQGIHLTSDEGTITNGEVTIKTNGSGTNGIYSESLITIGDENNADGVTPTINILRKSENDTSGVGIKSTVALTIHEGNIIVGDSFTYNNAIETVGLTVNGGDIQANGVSCGIVETGLLTINGGKVQAVNTVADNSKYIINCSNGLTITDGYVKVNANTNYGRGIMVSSGDTVISGGNLEIEVSGDCANGMQVDNALTVGTLGATTGPTIIITGDIQGSDNEDVSECALFLKKPFTMNSGNMKIDIKNSSDTKAISGIRAIESTAIVTLNGGTIDINVDVKQSDGTYGHGDGMSLKADLVIGGGKLVSKTNGTLTTSAALDTVANVTVSGGMAEFRNTNTLEDASNTGVGICSNTTLNINGGNVIAQGMNKAVSLTGTANVQYPESTGIYSVTTLVSTNYLGENLYIGESITDFSIYKYVEFGALFKRILKYKASANELYIGETSGGSTIKIELGDPLLDQIGIKPGATNGTLVFNGANFLSNLDYGLIIEGTTTIYLTENTSNRLGANIGTNGIGIFSDSTITIEGTGNLTVSGSNRAISATSIVYSTSGDYDLRPTCTSTSVTPIATTEYPSSVDYSTTKYIEIGPVANYYFKYDASNGKMYKVSSSEVDTPLTMNNQLVTGWSIGADKTLELDDFNFATTAKTGLMIVGLGQVSITDNNTITLLNGAQSTYNGLNITGDTILQGTGTLNLRLNDNSNNKYIGISSTGNITIKNGTYNIEGGSYGIQATGKTLDISNANVTVKGNTKAIDVGICNIHAKVEGSTDYNGVGAISITDINTTYSTTYSGYQYFNISPAVMNVNITWGSFSYTGEKTWNPSNHTYEGEWRTEDTDGDKVVVENTVESNIPIFTKIVYTSLNKPLLSSINASLSTYASKLEIGNSTNAKLSVIGMPEANIASSESIGSVIVTLSDYSIPD